MDKFTEKKKKIEAEFGLIEEKRKIKKLKREIRADFWTQVKGYIIFAYAILGTIATTSISIAGGINEYTHKYIFGLGVVTIQLGLFLLTQNETTIKKSYHDYYTIVKLLQLGLLFLSVRFNYIFFGNGPFTLLLCICFDVTILKAVAISSDFRALNQHSREIGDSSLLKMLIFNFTAKMRMNTLRAFNYNKAQYNLLLKKDAEVLPEKQPVIETKEAPKLFLVKDTKHKDKDRELIIKAIFEFKDENNICPSIKKLEAETGLTRTKIGQVKKELVNEGVLTSNNLKTIVNIDDIGGLLQ